MLPVEMVWYDGGIQPKRPEELLPDEPMAEWDGGIIFEGHRSAEDGVKIGALVADYHIQQLPIQLMQRFLHPAYQ